MKKIKLNQYIKTDDEYLILLGNGTEHRFPSKAKALRFLSKTSRFLTDRLYEYNSLFAELHYLYRLNWGFFDHDKKTLSGATIHMDMLIRKEFTTISNVDGLFDKVVKLSKRSGGNYYAFNHLRMIGDSLKGCCKSLLEINRKKSYAPVTYQLECLFNRLLEIETRINNYGQMKAVGHFETVHTPALNNLQIMTK
jgi:hypothetical protein